MAHFPKAYKLEDKVKAKLELYAMLDQRLAPIIEHPQTYPAILFQMLYVNFETLGFVANYPQQKDKVISDTIGQVTKGEIPLLLQWDKRWGYGQYGDAFLGATGCGPTALTMVIAGLTSRTDITPYTVAQYAQKHNYYVNGIGSSWDLISEGGSAFGVKAHVMGTDKGSIYLRLKQGYPIICSMGKGVFTTNGHYIVLSGIEKGKIKVKDPNSIIRSNVLWDFETFDDQIEACWYFSKK